MDHLSARWKREMNMDTDTVPPLPLNLTTCCDISPTRYSLKANGPKGGEREKGRRDAQVAGSEIKTVRRYATRGIINFTQRARADGSKRPVSSYGYLLASLPSPPSLPAASLLLHLLHLLPSHVQNACTRLLVYSRDISHYQGEPTAVVMEWGEERERETRTFLSLSLSFFLFIRPVRCGTRTRVQLECTSYPHRCAK